jgi:amidase
VSRDVSRETIRAADVSLPGSSRFYAFSAGLVPALSLDSGDAVEIETADCFSGQIQDEKTQVTDIDRRRVNPATGPIFVRGAAPGDTLAVDILDLRPGPHGLAVTTPGMGFLGDRVQVSRTRLVRLEANLATWGSLRLPIRPMLGVIGVAPREGEVSTVVPGPHGGNLDCALATAGTTVYLPIYHPGALFGTGDMHAAMGDGEVSGTGVEAGGHVTLRFHVRRDFPVRWPWLETPDGWVVIVSGEDLREISRIAAEEMVSFLMERTGRDFEEAYMLCGSAMTLAFCQVVNPLYSVRAEIPHLLTG